MFRSSPVSPTFLKDCPINSSTSPFDRHKIHGLSTNSFERFLKLISDIFAGKNEKLNQIYFKLRMETTNILKSTRENLSFTNIFICVNLILIGVFLAYIIYSVVPSDFWNLKERSPVFLLFSFLYSFVFIATGYSYIINSSNFFFNNLHESVEYFKILSFSILLITGLVYLLFIVFLAASMAWIFFYSFLVVGFCYFSFLINFNITEVSYKLIDGKILAFILSSCLFFFMAYFFYGYINEAFRNTRHALQNLIIYLPIVITFIIIITSFQYFHIEVLKLLFFPDMKVSKLSIAFRAIVYGISSNYSNVFIFTLIVSWSYNIASNMTTLFVTTLISCKLIKAESKNEKVSNDDLFMRIIGYFSPLVKSIIFSLTVCFNNFGCICYASIFPGFFSSLKAVLQFFATLVQQANFPIFGYFFKTIIHLLISFVDGMEIFFGSYNRVSFMSLGYELTRNHYNKIDEPKSDNIEVDNRKKGHVTFDNRILQLHPDFLIFSTPKYMNSILGTQPNNMFAYIFSRMNFVMHGSLKQYVFPFFLCFQLLLELTFLIGACIVLEKHHKLLEHENKNMVEFKENKQ